jgi:hypothetical protein
LSESCNVCGSALDDNGKCPECDSIIHVDGSRPEDDDFDTDGMKRTRPVKTKMDALRTSIDGDTHDDIDDEIELDPDKLKIDFDKIDTSLLFDDDLEEDKVTSKMLPQRMKPKETIIKSREITEAPSEEALRKREVYALPSINDNEVQDSKTISYRSKASMVKRKGSSLVMLIALAIILIIIISLWLAGFLEFVG